MKWRLTYKEITLIIGIAVALVIVLALWMRGNSFFQISENINFSESQSLRFVHDLVGQVLTDI
jgi:hypothetical protein